MEKPTWSGFSEQRTSWNVPRDVPGFSFPATASVSLLEDVLRSSAASSCSSIKTPSAGAGLVRAPGTWISQCPGKNPTSYTRIGIILEGCWAFSHSLIPGVSSVCGWLLSHSAWWDQAGKTTPGPALCGKSLIPLFPEPPRHLWTSGHLQSGKPICPSEQRVGTCDPFVCAIKI